MANVSELYQMLDTADKMAATGDAQAKVDAQEIAAQIKLEEAKAQKSGEFPEVLGGVLGAGAGATGQVARKAYNVGSNLSRAAESVNLLAEQAKANAAKPPIPTTVSQFHAPNMVTEHGFGPGAMKNIGHNVSQKIGNPLHASLAEKPIPGYGLEGNRMVITPTNMAGAPSPSGLPASPAQPSSAFTNAVDRAKQLSAPVGRVASAGLRALGPVAGGFGAGYQGAETYNRLDRGDTLGGVISGIGAGAGLASMYPPFAPVGIPVSLAATAINELRDKYRSKQAQKNLPQQPQGGLPGPQ